MKQVQGYGVYGALADIGHGRVAVQIAALEPPERRRVGEHDLVEGLEAVAAPKFREAPGRVDEHHVRVVLLLVQQAPVDQPLYQGGRDAALLGQVSV